MALTGAVPPFSLLSTRGVGLCPRRHLRDDHEQKRPVCTPTYEKRRQLKKTTKVKYENEDPPLSPLFVGLWRRDGALLIHEQHGDSQHTATRRAHTHIAITKEAKK